MGKKARGLLSAVKKVFRHSSKVKTPNEKEKDKKRNEEHLPTESSLELKEHSEYVRHVAINRTEYSKEHQAAVAIQSYYRGYLARRALRALKSLVKLQALVRGYNVRKQAQMTMRCMQSLVRVQERVKARRLQLTEEKLRSTEGNQRRRQQWCTIPEDEEDRTGQGWSWFEKWRSTQPLSPYARLALDDTSEMDANTPRTGRMLSPARSTLSKNSSVPGYMAPTESARAKVRERGYFGNYNDCSTSGGNLVPYHGSRSPTWRSNQGSSRWAKKAYPGNEPISFLRREMEAV